MTMWYLKHLHTSPLSISYFSPQQWHYSDNKREMIHLNNFVQKVMPGRFGVLRVQDVLSCVVLLAV